MSSPLVSLESRDLACVRGGRTVFTQLNFSVEGGNVLVLEGPNGSGKTSALRILAGLLPQAAGTISIRTESRAVTDTDERGQLCGWLGHHDGVKAQLTVEENMRFFASLYRSRIDMDVVLERVGLGRLRHAPVQYLSAGQKRRLALARLIATNRPLWLLDEPFAALDARARMLMTELIELHCHKGGIVVVATHEPLGIEAARLALGKT